MIIRTEEKSLNAALCKCAGRLVNRAGAAGWSMKRLFLLSFSQRKSIVCVLWSCLHLTSEKLDIFAAKKDLVEAMRINKVFFTVQPSLVVDRGHR